MEIEGLNKRRASLVGQTDMAAAKARIDAAETALKLARQRAAQALIRAPIAGLVYELTARPGEYLSLGSLVANIGLAGRLRVRVYVDEPELGRVAQGESVAITWDALPGKSWQGTVERMPARIEALGSRQVGEVACVIENPRRELPLGANVNAEIRTAEAPDALVIPKEALRRDAAGDYVFALAAGHIERRPVQTGISSVSLAQISQGLAPGDLVALPADVPLKPGDAVTAVVEWRNFDAEARRKPTRGLGVPAQTHSSAPSAAQTTGRAQTHPTPRTSPDVSSAPPRLGRDSGLSLRLRVKPFPLVLPRRRWHGRGRFGLLGRSGARRLFRLIRGQRIGRVGVELQFGLGRVLAVIVELRIVLRQVIVQRRERLVLDGQKKRVAGDILEIVIQNRLGRMDREIRRDVLGLQGHPDHHMRLRIHVDQAVIRGYDIELSVVEAEVPLRARLVHLVGERHGQLAPQRGPVVPFEAGLGLPLEDLVQHGAQIAADQRSAQGLVILVGHLPIHQDRLVVFLLFEEAQPDGESVLQPVGRFAAGRPAVSGAGRGRCVAARHLRADEVRQVLL